MVSKSFILLGKSFWATFIDIWQLFTGHTAVPIDEPKNFITKMSLLVDLSAIGAKC